MRCGTRPFSAFDHLSNSLGGCGNEEDIPGMGVSRVLAAWPLVTPDVVGVGLDAEGAAPAPPTDAGLWLLWESEEAAGFGILKASLPPVEAAAEATALWLLCWLFFWRLLGGSMLCKAALDPSSACWLLMLMALMNGNLWS